MCLGSACVMYAIASFSLHVRADAKPLEQSPWLYRIARTAHGVQVETLLDSAEDHVDMALRAFPTSFRIICERTQELRLSVDSAAVRKGRSRALTLFSQQAVVRRDALDRALADLERARRLEPNDPDIARARVRALVLWEEPASVERCEVRQRTAAAIEALRELHALRPEEVGTSGLFELGSLLARQGDYAGAVVAYRSAISLAFDDSERSAAYAQLAQAKMLAGDAAAALPDYQRALATATPGRASAILHFGMAVALDRLGEHSAALEQAVAAMEAAERSLDVLAPDNVQFEPATERFVYQALAHEAMAQLMPEAKALSLEAAAESYAAFLTNVDPGHLYRNAAEADLRAVVAQLGAAGSPSRER
jgi:tetratricopeptide (TPR) repeat protein